MLKSRLKALREQKKMTQGEISKRLGMARTTYSGYENGSRDPDPDTIRKIADFHEVTIDYLLGRDTTTYKDLTPNETDFIIREIVQDYNLDLTIPGQREKLEDLIKIVLADYTKKR